MDGCPVRKLAPPEENAGPDLEMVEGPDGPRLVVRGFEAARTVLRSETVRQAGFGAETIGRSADRMRPPILYLHGSEHREQRKAAARLFAPAVIEGYRPMMEELAGRLVAELREDRGTDLSRLSLRMAVEVAARTVGLTNSSLSGMTRRLNTFFAGDPLWTRRTLPALAAAVRSQAATFAFFNLDVKPAIRARRREPQEDVISQLIAAGFSDLEILTECVTYGAAGMVTTREFITAAAWHLLDAADLLQRYRSAEGADRIALLAETLRLEPVVGHLYRRTEEAVELAGNGTTRTVPAGTMIDLHLRPINADPSAVGPDGTGLCPGRELRRGVPASMMSFGDGAHKCPGGPLALMETEVFLSALFAREVSAAGPPRVRWNPVTEGYDLDRFMIRVSA